MAGPASERAKKTVAVLPLHAEEATVAKRREVTGRVQVRLSTRVEERRIQEPLARERVEIERRPIGKPVEQAPVMREDEDVIVIPVVEEEIVVQRRLILKEEIRIRRIRETERCEKRVHLRKQKAIITRRHAAAPESNQTPAKERKEK